MLSHGEHGFSIVMLIMHSLTEPHEVHQLQSLRLKLEDGGSQVAEQLLEEYNVLVATSSTFLPVEMCYSQCQVFRSSVF